MVGGGVRVGTVSGRGDVIIAGSDRGTSTVDIPADRPLDRPLDRPADAPLGAGFDDPEPEALFSVTFVNNSPTTYTLSLYDRSRKSLGSRSLRTGESISATLGERFTYSIVGPSIVRSNGIRVSGATQTGTISSSNRRIVFN